jgi:hypothetical protein
MNYNQQALYTALCCEHSAINNLKMAEDELRQPPLAEFHTYAGNLRVDANHLHETHDWIIEKLKLSDLQLAAKLAKI